MKDKTVCVVGLGYVGLPLATAFSKHLKTIGFDIDRAKIQYKKSMKRTMITLFAHQTLL